MTYEELIDLEKISQSEYSPCVISDDEIVVRVFFYPKHYLNGEVLPMAFDQVTNEGGMSILRKNHYWEKSLRQTISQIENDIVKYCAYASGKVENIRTLKVNNLRLCYVLDTATKEKQGHADIYSIKYSIDECGLPKKGLKAYVRKEIAKVFNQLTIFEKRDKK